MSETRDLIGRSAAFNAIVKLIDQVAKTNANVLILGESGTGKELVAREIHRLSQRAGGPFIPVNCAAIPAELLESELFGHEKGAFTGALNTRAGRFELALNGSLFLDEIGDMPLSMQVKLLRVLQEKTFERVGGNRSLQANVRIIAATNKNLETAIDEGRFREDLYYRLNVFPITTPPLRQRVEDIPLLIQHFQSKSREELGQTFKWCEQLIDQISQYEWPGNIRELANFVERMSVLAPNKTIEQHLLPEKMQKATLFDQVALQTPTDGASASASAFEPFDLKEYLKNIELECIHRALSASQGVVSKAAELLGLRRTTLVEKMKKYQIDRAWAANA